MPLLNSKMGLLYVVASIYPNVSSAFLRRESSSGNWWSQAMTCAKMQWWSRFSRSWTSCYRRMGRHERGNYVCGLIRYYKNCSTGYLTNLRPYDFAISLWDFNRIALMVHVHILNSFKVFRNAFQRQNSSASPKCSTEYKFLYYSNLGGSI